MGKSFRRTPISGRTSCNSEKTSKRRHNRKMRMEVRRRLIQALYEDPDLFVDPLPNEISNIYHHGKDGKIYWGKDDMETVEGLQEIFFGDFPAYRKHLSGEAAFTKWFYRSWGK